jgi:glycolate dehydrogenase FAD-linked subunit
VGLSKELGAITSVLDGAAAAYLNDSTEVRGLHGRADAVVLPESAEEVAAVLAWCYENDVAIVARGGGTGYAGGAVPDGGVVLALERLNRVRSFDPLLWRMNVEAGVTTGDVRRLAREHGLMFPPDPGGAEQSQIGGNIATNAGGPHAFKYGVTGKWVTGVEAAVPPGELITVGGPTRKDVAGYDLKSLLIGSEGTLGIVTAAWLRLVPAPEAALPVAAFYDSIAAGCRAIERIYGSGLEVAVLEYLDGGTIEATGASFPVGMPADAGFLVIVEADGSAEEATRLRDEAASVLSEGALSVTSPSRPGEIARLWRWRDGVTFAVSAQMGAKLSEDLAVPLDRLEEAIEGTLEIGCRYNLPACSWGHAGDGNVHSTFLLAPEDPEQLERASCAADDLLTMALQLGGTVSGEHGLGVVRSGWLARQWGERAVALHAQIKGVFDPKGLMNPGKKV